MNLFKHVIIPIAVLVAVAMIVVVGFVWFSAKRQDEIALRYSIDSVRDAVARKTDQVGRVAKDYSWWNDAARHLAIELDSEWADLNIAFYIYENYDYEMSFVVDGRNRTTYASNADQRFDRDAFATLSQGLDRLIADARAAPLDEPEPATGLLAVDGEVVMVGVSAVTREENAEFELPPGPRVVIVYVKRMDQAFLDGIAAPLPLHDLRFEGSGTVAATAVLPLVTPADSTLGNLVWVPHQPGSEFLRSVTPSLAIAIAVIALFTASVLRHARQATSAIEASEARFRDVADASSDWIWETDGDRQLTYLSERFVEITGRRPGQMIGRPLDDLLHPAESTERWQRHLDDRHAWQPFRNLLCLCEDKQGRNRTLRVAGKAVLDEHGQPIGYRGTATDITNEIDAERRAHYLSLHDSLTELPNRELLGERIDQAVAAVSRRRDLAAILCIDLDRFKDVNDTRGHPIGDLLLQSCAERLQACVREVDTVARIGGDEFAIVQVGLADADDTHRLCRRLLHAIATPFDLEGHEVLVSASIGVALVPADGSIPARLLRNADIALSRAKEDGANTFRFFESDMDARIQERIGLERDLRHALGRGELELHYQPKVRLAGRRVSGAEALVRWRHPERGMVRPDQFIGIAEEIGLIVPLGEWVLRTACAQARQWPDLDMSVNVSPVQFRQSDLVAVVKDVLDETGLAPTRLALEITEGVLMQDIDAAVATLGALKELGVKIDMDDFGTGYSSLSYIQKFPFDKIKIDRSFVRDLGERVDGIAIVRAVVGLGASLGIQTCAEGVETAAELALLEQEGCDEVQGYYFGRPVPAEMFEEAYVAAAASGLTSKELVPAE